MGLLDDAIKDHLELKRRHGADPSEVARQEHEALGPARREPAAAAVAPVPDERALVDQDDFEDAPPLDDDDVLVDDEDADDAPLLDDDYEDEVIADERLDAPLHRAHGQVPEPEAAAPEAAPLPESTVDQPTRQFSLHELEDASRGPAEVEEASSGPAEVEDASSGPAEVEDASSGPAEVEEASSGPAEVEDASSGPAEVEDAPPGEPAAAQDEREPHADVVPADDEPDPEDVLEETPEFLQETPEHDRLWFEQKPPRDFDF
jgi:hypothetical protein